MASREGPGAKLRSVSPDRASATGHGSFVRGSRLEWRGGGTSDGMPLEAFRLCLSGAAALAKAEIDSGGTCVLRCFVDSARRRAACIDSIRDAVARPQIRASPQSQPAEASHRHARSSSGMQVLGGRQNSFACLCLPCCDAAAHCKSSPRPCRRNPDAGLPNTRICCP
jgi:hypothetical protein